MSQQRETRIRPDTPQDNWTVVHRLRSYGDVEYGKAHADFFSDSIKDAELPSSVTAEDGMLYVRYDLPQAIGEAALQRTTQSLWLGISRLALQGEVETAIERTALVSDEMTIGTSFQYFQDVSVEAEGYLEEASLQTQDAPDFTQELEQLLTS